MNPKNQKNKKEAPESGKCADECSIAQFFKKLCPSEKNQSSGTETREKSSPCGLYNAIKAKAKQIFKKRGKCKIFKLNERVGEEDLYTEFKNFSCNDIMKEQYKILTKLICGFLNTQGGKIFIGVDNSSSVKGKLNYYHYYSLNLYIYEKADNLQRMERRNSRIHYLR